VPLPRRARIRDEKEVAGRAAALRALVLVAAGEPPPEGDPPFSPAELQLVSRPPAEWDEQELTDALWRGEALGALAWALGLVDELPGYDEPFDHAALARGIDLAAASLRPGEQIEQARETARLWHWRARTTLLQGEGSVELPERWASFDQLVAAAAMRGYEIGLLPAPLRGDFPAFGKVYRHLDASQHALALSIAAERHLAFEWLVGDGPWDGTVTDT
jgi:hypothetical protein